MGDTYFVEERSGTVEIGPLAYYSPQYYPRRAKANWNSLKTWIHLISCLLACPLVIWNLYLLLDLILNYSLKSYWWFGFLLAFCAILTYLFAGVMVLIVEAAGISERLAKFLFIIAYLSIAISIFALILTHNIIGIIWMILLLILLILYGMGLGRFLLVSSIHLNEEGPLWLKPLLYACFTLIPILSASRQCRNKPQFGCLSNDWFGGREMFMDLFSFTLMAIITALSLIPLILNKKKQPAYP